MMKILLLLALVTVSHARSTGNDCTGVIIDNINHEKELLKTNVDSPYQLALDYDTNYLFFSYTCLKTKGFCSAVINLKTNEFKDITNIEGGFANAVDPKNDIVYLGGRDGIYKYDFESNEAVHQNITQDNIWQMFFKDRLYYTEYPSEVAKVVKNGRAQVVKELSGTRAMLVAINKHDDIIFSNSTGLFKYRRDTSKIVALGIDVNANSITTDQNQNIYFSSPDGLYTLDEKDKIKRIALIDDVYGMAIEGDNTLIYCDNNNVYRLKRTNSYCADIKENQVYDY